jgi:hypothetical protein
MPVTGGIGGLLLYGMVIGSGTIVAARNASSSARCWGPP